MPKMRAAQIARPGAAFEIVEREIPQPAARWVLKRTGKIVKTDFAIVLTVANGEIVRFQMLEDSFAVSQAARG